MYRSTSIRAVLSLLLLCGALLVAPALGGSIDSWGYDGYGQVSNTPTGTGFTAIDSGSEHGIALRTDGSIASWGSNLRGQVSNTPAGTGYTAVAAGAYHSLALRADGSIAGWGYCNYGQAWPPDFRGYTAIAAGAYHSLALRADGSIESWGNNDFGQVSQTPAGTGYRAVAGGGWYSLALKADGSIVSWGRNDQFQVSQTPAGTGFVAIAAGGSHSLALRADGSIIGWGRNDGGQASPPAGTGYTAVAAGEGNSLALRADGSIAGWGWDTNGQVSQKPAGTGYAAVAAGSRHGLALRPSPPAPVASFDTNTTSGPAPLPVQFTDTSTGIVTSRAWRFGDGGTSTGRDPVHTYTSPGDYTVTLEVGNEAGSATATRTVTVLEPPATNFTWTPAAPRAGEEVAFTDTSSGGPITWEWAFGDGATSTERNPVHAYAAPGNYTVRLTAYFPGSEIGRDADRTIAVAAPPPVGGSTGYFLVSTAPAGATVSLRDIGGDLHPAGNTSAGPLNVTVYLTGTPMTALVANLSGYADAVYPIASYPPAGGTVRVNLTLAPAVRPVTPSTLLPTDTDADGVYDDVNGNGRKDFADVVLYFNQMTWIAANEPAGLFDCNGNGRIDFADVVWLFNHL